MLSDTMMLGGGRKAAYPIENSLLFRSGQYLSRTPSVEGNRQKFTISAWVRRAQLGTHQEIFTADDGVTNTDRSWFQLMFNSSDKLLIGGGVTNWRITTAVYRDVTADYHVVASVDTTTQTVKLYVNGVEVTAFDMNHTITANLQTAVNSGVQHRWGGLNRSGGQYYLDGYLAEPILVDGAALTPASFGEVDSVTGSWRPKDVTLPAHLPVYAAIPQTAGTAIGDMTMNGGLNAAFNGVSNSSYPNCACWADGYGGYHTIGKNWGTATTIGQVIAIGANDSGFGQQASNAASTNSFTITLQGSNDGTVWNDLGSSTQKNQAGLVVTITAATLVPYTQHRLYIQCPDSFYTYCAEVQFHTNAATSAFGTNGCHLGKPWNSESLGTDYSGRGNTWVASNFASTDEVADTPTNVYATLNPLAAGSALTFTAGNLVFGPSSGQATVCSTLAVPTSGGWYAEFTCGLATDASSGWGCGVCSNSVNLHEPGVWDADAWTIYASAEGALVGAGQVLRRFSSFSANEVVSIAVRYPSVWIARNGQWLGAVAGESNPLTGTNPAFTVGLGAGKDLFYSMVASSSSTASIGGANFGQHPFAYTPPAGFKALCTANMAAATGTVSGSFIGTLSADGPCVFTGAVPQSLSINGNAVTWGTHADKLATGFKVRTASAAYNAAASNSWTATYDRKPTVGPAKRAPANAQAN